ncbi:S41 family peptidase [Spirosoma utsteinense]|uniref:C-terminal processing protease CtpA/Prc n=1 Tax=Spirosoma utsteinense TaxID=2585773 RepID=A0ABR6W9K6_9BACT|nr:S41 family peptidase [Spirosoma utsteinense]MBC3787170.1 C-terminal processing protease CtpA/Prc [Spirosoma utsteinense]MBC3792853.1 C-terminal processing protease CtpA/Prc [Spirosoma utsteinense]
MIAKHLKYVVAGLAILLLSGCERLLIDSDKSSEPVENFDRLWQKVRDHYPYFKYKNLDWDSVYNQYRPSVNEGTSDAELYKVITAMLSELKDGHISVYTPDNYYAYNFKAGYAGNYDSALVRKFYLDKPSVQYVKSGGFTYAILDNNIGYIHYRTFNRDVDTIDAILQLFEREKVKGLIMDVRNNGGGQIGNVLSLAGRFTASQLNIGHTVFKKGPEPDNFTEPLRVYVNPEGATWTKPVVLLTNRACFSACSFFTEAMRQIPNVTTLGDMTGGGGAMPLEYELPNGWRYRVSTSAFYGFDGFNIEGGVPPDIRVDMNQEHAKQGRDDLIEQASQQIERK